MPTIYCISGLGADEHIFDGLTVPGVTWVHLPWLMPDGDETIEAYAGRMKAGISYASPPVGEASLPAPAEEAPVLLGFSFGGMIAVEIAKYLPTATVIIVSSIWHGRQLPVPIKMTKHLRLGKWSPPANLRLLAPLQDYFLGVETPADSRLVREYRGNVDPHYLQWSIRQIAGWQNTWQPASFYHLHGTRDRVFPIHRVKPTHVVEGGGHFMIHNRGAEISRILRGIAGIGLPLVYPPQGEI
jgi:pimeloyl-ACP methyl ester carboxylesterase